MLLIFVDNTSIPLLNLKEEIEVELKNDIRMKISRKICVCYGRSKIEHHAITFCFLRNAGEHDGTWFVASNYVDKYS